MSLELPGLNKDEIAISPHSGVLTVSGEHRDGEAFHSERTFGKFQRSVTLPATVDAARVKATCKDGILRVELPKAEEAKPKQIAVSVS